MKIKQVSIRGFRRLENITVDLEESETIFVGPNNSGKTTATAAFRCFLGEKQFTLHDFSTSKLLDFDGFDPENPDNVLPFIEFDVWFSIDPDNIAFGRAFSLLPNLSDDFSEVGLRCKLEAKSAKDLWADYEANSPRDNEGIRKSLSHFLGSKKNLSKHFELNYFSLEKTEDGLVVTPLESSEGKRLIKSLVRVDFIDAQRNLDEGEVGRGNRLSSAFAYFYEKNLEKPEAEEEAYRVINENNERLTDHYRVHFEPLMNVIRDLGVPSVHDRDLKLVSALSAETALKGSADLMYVDPASLHELPEAYNGLGFKNLIFMAVQISHAHLQWINTEKDRPLCQLIFIEEPEVHLHAQVQQTFISNIWDLLNRASEDAGTPSPQLAITTHSSHILDAADFAKIRYFRRCPFAREAAEGIQRNSGTTIHSLRDFTPEPVEIEGAEATGPEVLDFLKKYLKLTHCDLFFADAAVLVEGTVEKLLLPAMVRRSANGLLSKYLTILEVGGAYAHRFVGLLDFLHIPYLIVTDIDSVDPNNGRKICRTDAAGAVSSNVTLKGFLNDVSIEALKELGAEEKANELRFLAYEMPVVIVHEGEAIAVHGRTLEEAFVYENLALVANRDLAVSVTIPDNPNDVFESVYKQVKKSGFKKTEFAMDVLSSTSEWATPEYIAEGLRWLEQTLTPQPQE
ncbi:AAA family ATPase [Ruegeria pomeroyi]|uniref:AAA family ATPase n=1 Tax=Ruegeria pomeroyi TaxID=89184 RepID=A0A9Q3ZNJ6_9RHOB|nr:AAA family ATPase [Ruegeria pomeroyi]MCE8539233.1 AAA family ATPase [Ruegeria pomeroyi]